MGCKVLCDNLVSWVRAAQFVSVSLWDWRAGSGCLVLQLGRSASQPGSRRTTDPKPQSPEPNSNPPELWLKSDFATRAICGQARERALCSEPSNIWAVIRSRTEVPLQ